MGYLASNIGWEDFYNNLSWMYTWFITILLWFNAQSVK